jgi:hypothetical protein
MYICRMGRISRILLCLVILLQALGLQASRKTCKMAKDGDSRHCPCTPKKNKNKCCKSGLKPVKHFGLAQKTIHKCAEKVFFPALLISCRVFPEKRKLSSSNTEKFIFGDEPPDPGIALFLLFRKIVC